MNCSLTRSGKTLLLFVGMFGASLVATQSALACAKNGYAAQRSQLGKAPAHQHGRVVFHRVKSGETLYNISRRYRVSVASIIQLNLSLIHI